MASRNCKECGGQTIEFSAEMCLHFSGGLESLWKPQVITYTDIRVCLSCGATESRLPKETIDTIGKEIKEAASIRP